MDGNVLTVSTINGVTTNYSYPHYGMPSNWTGNRALTWINGIDLASIGGTTFTYDGEGQRVSKTTGATITSYTYEGDQLVMQTTGNTSLFFLYDSNGLIGFDKIESGTTTAKYYYQIDGKGEIVGITDTAGNVVVKYTYDAWGNPISVTDANSNTITDTTHIGVINPFRYKSYYYDTDTGLYYLNSRYYDPQVSRFINADNQLLLGDDLLGLNLYAYCGNNPVNRVDPTGEAWWHWAVGAAIVAATAVATVVTCGSFAAAVTAVGLVGNGMAAATTAATVATAAFIGSATAYGVAVLSAAANSNSVEEFNEQGNLGTVAATIGGGIVGGIAGGINNTNNFSTNSSSGKGYDTFNQLKKDIGSPGTGNHWHHIVEQNQIAKSGFSAQMIHNTNNITRVNAVTHGKISGYYSSIQPFTNGMKVRNWLVGQSFEAQYEFGINVIKMFE